MIDNELNIYNLIATRLRQEYEDIYITKYEFNDVPPRFPAVSITASSNLIRGEYSTFAETENVVSETIKVETVSNLTEDKKPQVREIMQIVDDVLTANNYIRIFYEPIPSPDTTKYREIGRWRNTILTKGDMNNA